MSNLLDRFRLRSFVRTQAYTAVDKTPAFKVFFVGDRSKCPEPAVGLDISEFKFTFYKDLTNTVIDNSINATGTITATGANSLIANTVAVINATKNWRAVPIGILSTDKWGTAGANLVADIAAAAITSAGTTVYLKTVASAAGSPGVQSMVIGPESLGDEFASGPARRSNKDLVFWDKDPALALSRPSGYARQCRDYVNVLEYLTVTMGSTASTLPTIEIYSAGPLSETLLKTFSPTATAAATTSYDLAAIHSELMAAPGQRLLARLQATGTVSAVHAMQLAGACGFLDDLC